MVNFFISRPAAESARVPSTTNVPSSTPSSSERRSSSATRSSASASHRHRDRANSSANRHSTSSLNPPRVSSAHTVSQNNRSQTQSTNCNSNCEGNSSPSEGDFPRRRSTRRRNYLNRNQLHNAVDLPEGYGKKESNLA